VISVGAFSSIKWAVRRESGRVRGLDTLVVWEAFFARRPEHKGPEIDVGDVDRRVGRLSRHGGQQEKKKETTTAIVQQRNETVRDPT
jgi:hypothetical protein